MLMINWIGILGGLMKIRNKKVAIISFILLSLIICICYNIK